PWRFAPVPPPGCFGGGTRARFARGSSGATQATALYRGHTAARRVPGKGRAPRTPAVETAATTTRSPPARTTGCGAAGIPRHATDPGGAATKPPEGAGGGARTG